MGRTATAAAVASAVDQLLAAGDAAAASPRYSAADFEGKPFEEWPTVTVPVPVYAVLWAAASERDLSFLLAGIPPETASLDAWAPSELVPGEPLCPGGRPAWWDSFWIGLGSALVGATLVKIAF
jgi:hypothetical protein